MARPTKYPEWIRDLINTRFKKNPERWMLTHYYDMECQDIRMLLEKYNERVNISLNEYKSNKTNGNYWQFKECKNCCAVLREILNHEYPKWNDKYNNEFFEHTKDIHLLDGVSGIYSDNEGHYYNVALSEDEESILCYSNDSNHPTDKDVKSVYQSREGVWSMNDSGKWIREDLWLK